MKKRCNTVCGFIGRFLLFGVQFVFLCILLTFCSDELLCGCRISGEMGAYLFAMLFSASKTGLFLYGIKHGKKVYTLWEYIEGICFCLPGWFFLIQIAYLWRTTDLFAQNNDAFSQVLRLSTIFVLAFSPTLRFAMITRAKWIYRIG